MNLPAYFLPQPTANWDEQTICQFEALYKATVASGSGEFITYTLDAPKWQFLCYVCEQKPILLHGSGNGEIAEFEPRQSNDVNEFGNRRAVYAASDGIWPIYFAVMDRDRYVTSLTNSCFHVLEPTGRSGPYYFFSINADALPHCPWRNGTIYLLPAENFEQQPRILYRGMEIDLAQWASPVAVRPLAKLAVTPNDFPFLADIVPHDPAVVEVRARANPDGFPWLDE